MAVWQVTGKRETGSPMTLREFPSWWRAVLWMARMLRNNRIVMIVKIDE